MNTSLKVGRKQNIFCTLADSLLCVWATSRLNVMSGLSTWSRGAGLRRVDKGSDCAKKTYNALTRYCV